MGFITAVALCIQALSAQTVSAFSNGNMRIVVDAGHGGIDCGVSGRQTEVKESDLNLSIANALKGVLEDAGFEVIMTRKTQGGLYDTTAKGFKKRDMLRRREIIQNADPALVLSVHQNFYPAKGTRGAQTFYFAQSEEGEALALSVQENLNALYEGQGAKPRKVMKGEYFILRCAPCPSILVECGFLSNAEDERLLQTPAWQKSIAESIAAGVLAFYGNAVA